MKKYIKRYVMYPLQGLALFLFWAVSKPMGLRLSSWLWGKILRGVGPLTGANKIAKRNLQKIWPERAAEHPNLIKDIWENQGRIVGEYPHLGALYRRIETDPTLIEGKEILERIRDGNQHVFFVSGHFGNWEAANLTIRHMGLKYVSMYREPNNPVAAWWLMKMRHLQASYLLPKGPLGAKGLIKRLKEGTHAGFLMDQKMNDGIEVPFMGHPAMTAPAMASLAVRHDIPIYMCHVVREGGTRLVFKMEDALKYEKGTTREETIVNILTAVNTRIGEWVEENPEQWLWLHNRWK